MKGTEQLIEAVDSRIASDPKLRAVRKRLGSGKGSFADTFEYALRSSQIAGRELSLNLTELDNREDACTRVLYDRYSDINAVCAQLQTELDEEQGVHIRPQKADFPQERVGQLSHSLSDPTVPEEVQKRRAESGTANVGTSFHDDYIRKNAAFRNDAGLKCYIIREGTGCCEWCSSVAGKYKIGDQPEDIFRRHDNCDCTITYDGQKLRGRLDSNGRRTRTWEEIGDAPAEFEPASFTQEQAKELERQNLQRFRGLTNGENRVTISGRGSGTGSSVSGNHTYEKIGEINFNDKNAVAESLAEFERKYSNSDIEHCRVICKNGEVYEVHGDRYRVDTELLGDKMSGSINEHNHVTGESQHSFSWEDLDSSVKDGSHIALAYDEKYRYSMTFPDTIISEDSVLESYQRAKESVGNDMIFNPEKVPVGDEQHERIKRACEELGIKYARVPR